MPDILIRGLNASVVKRLKNCAKRNGRSLQKETRLLIERAAGADRHEVARIFDRWDTRFAGRKFSSSVDLIHEDRTR
ncbi:MAG: FitA-like ribbon-helix-helix domain-containing protein [Phycisphaerae bacterium]|jgi:plasmid stability protein